MTSEGIRVVATIVLLAVILFQFWLVRRSLKLAKEASDLARQAAEQGLKAVDEWKKCIDAGKSAANELQKLEEILNRRT